MFKDSRLAEFESQLKGISSENDRLEKNWDEVVSRQSIQKQQQQHCISDEEQSRLLVLQQLQEKVQLLETAKTELEASLQSKQEASDKLLSDLVNTRQTADLSAENLRKENSLVLKELKDLQVKLNKVTQDKDESISNLQSESKKFQEALSTAQLELKKIEQAKTLMESELKSTHARLDQFQKDNNSLQAELDLHTSEQQGLGHQLQEKDSILSELQQHISQLKESVTSHENEKLGLSSQLSDLHTTLTTKNTELQLVQDKVYVLENKIVEMDLRDKSSESENIQRLNEDVQQKEHIILQLKAQVEDMDKKSGDLLDEIAKAQAKYNVIQQDCDKNNLMMKSLEDKLETKVQEVSQLETRLQALETTERENGLLTRQISEIQAKYDTMQGEYDTNNSKDKENFANLSSELTRYKELVHQNESIKTSLQSQLTGMQERVSQLELDKNTLHAEIKAHVSQQSGFDNTLKERDAIASDLRLRLTELTENIHNQENIVSTMNNELDGLKSELQKKQDQLQLSEENSSRLQSKLTEKIMEDASISSEAIKRLEIELEEKNDTIANFQSQVDEMATFEIENSELVLQISEMQSKCDELEEENNFLKNSAQQGDDDALKRKISDLEGDLLDKTQMLKQQSLQLQDLRRSLAKEINKNQSLSESASPMEMASSFQCNGAAASATSQLILSSSSSSGTSTQPPTLPPQETDVNFMYLRSVLFKYLTTTDAQVTQQLTRVVATLLHLNEEESHLLSQATESRKGFLHVLGKS
ncbi:sporulation-specific protein 15 isoform X2 [Folsomia candida]|nr:sporulation-specific protein 15 isoform X2 [Folsomia candida]